MEKIAQNLRKLRRFCAIFVSLPLKMDGNVLVRQCLYIDLLTGLYNAGVDWGLLFEIGRRGAALKMIGLAVLKTKACVLFAGGKDGILQN